MRKLSLILLAVLLLLPAAALAAQMPPDIAPLFSDAKWSGYQIAAGSGLEENGQLPAQIALLMKKGGHNVLCIIEKSTPDGTYGITVETDKAVYQGSILPSLYIDTAGDALFYSYQFESGSIAAEHYSVLKAHEQWGPVGLILFEKKEEGLWDEIMIAPIRGTLQYGSARTDSCGNILAQEAVKSAPALPARMYLLENFDIGELPKTYEEARQKYQSLPYAGTLLFSSEQVIAAGASPLTFEIWGTVDAGAGLRRADVVRVKSGGETRQEIPIGQEEWPEFGESILFADANFDGYMDFLICRSGSAYNLYYDYWLWDAAQHQYAESQVFSALEAYPSFDAATRQIHCFAKDGAAQYYEYDYQVDALGLPLLTAMRDIRYESAGKRTISLYQPENGALKLVRQWTE